MGHKINPNIFRLGVSKSWSFQFRTNKNFIKNLFLFKFLRNLFMNYTIPFFTFENRRNKIEVGKVVLRGDTQIIPSPFIKNNLLFSHVYFGAIKNKLMIESFFIDVAFKQQRKRTDFIKRNKLLDIKEYKPWNSLFYKPSLLSRFDRKTFKNKLKLRKTFRIRIFKFLSKHQKIKTKKSIKRLSKDFYLFFRNFKAKYYRNLKRFLNRKFKFYLLRKNIKIVKKKTTKKYRFFIENPLLFKLGKKRIIKLRKSLSRYNSLFFVRNKIKRIRKRFKNRLAFRYIFKIKKKSILCTHRYKKRKLIKGYRRITLIKFLSLVSRSYFTSKHAIEVKRSFPKHPLYIYDSVLSSNKKYVSYYCYKNLKLLKYFIRILSFLKYFSIKKKIFFSQNLISLIINFFGLSNTSILTKKLYLVLHNLVFYSLGFSFFNFVNFKKNFFSKFAFFKGVSKTVHRSVMNFTKTNQLIFSVVAQNKFRFNSSLVLNYILIKLGQYFSIHDIINPLSYYIKTLNSIAGYRILVTGRLTRKERAAVLIRSGKRMPLSTITANIDYSSGFKIMKFGLVGIKVYLFMNPSKLVNLYRFKFIFKDDAKIT